MSKWKNERNKTSTLDNNTMNKRLVIALRDGMNDKIVLELYCLLAHIAHNTSFYLNIQYTSFRISPTVNIIAFKLQKLHFNQQGKVI